MTPTLLLTPVLIPVLLAIVILIIPKGAKRAHAALFLIGTAAAFAFAAVCLGTT